MSLNHSWNRQTNANIAGVERELLRRKWIGRILCKMSWLIIGGKIKLGLSPYRAFLCESYISRFSKKRLGLIKWANVGRINTEKFTIVLRISSLLTLFTVVYCWISNLHNLYTPKLDKWYTKWYLLGSPFEIYQKKNSHEHLYIWIHFSREQTSMQIKQLIIIVETDELLIHYKSSKNF